LIWDACSQMDNYVQLLFPKKYRNALFGDRWFQFIAQDSQSLFSLLSQNEDTVQKENEGITFDEIVESEQASDLTEKINNLQNENVVNASDSHPSLLLSNFKDFLFNDLNLMLTSQPANSLDNKSLLNFLNTAIHSSTHKSGFVMDPPKQTLKTKISIDQYVLK